MKKIYKVEIRPNSEIGKPFRVPFSTHKLARPISVAMQGGKVVMWVEVDTSHPVEEQYVYSVGTGFGSPPKNCRFVGTVQQGPYVWHIYADH